MKNIISKELLSEVMDFVNPIDEVGNVNAFDNTFYVTFKNQCGKNINIYELAFRNCLDWAKIKGFMIQVNSLGTVQIFPMKSLNNSLLWVDDILEFEKLEVYEKIFKACQWILDNKND